MKKVNLKRRKKKKGIKLFLIMKGNLTKSNLIFNYLARIVLPHYKMRVPFLTVFLLLQWKKKRKTTILTFT